MTFRGKIIFGSVLLAVLSCFPTDNRAQSKEEPKEKNRCEVLREEAAKRADPEKMPVSSSYILNKLNFTSRITTSNDQLNSGLIAEIKKRGVDFALNDLGVNEIKDAGGSDALVKAIEDGLSNERREKLKDFERLDTVIRKNYVRNSTIGVAVDAGREMLAKYSDFPEGCPMIEWLKVQLPKWEARTTSYTNTQR